MIVALVALARLPILVFLLIPVCVVVLVILVSLDGLVFQARIITRVSLVAPSILYGLVGLVCLGA